MLAGSDVAAAFDAAASRLVEGSLPRGLDGIAAVAEAIDAFVFEGEEDDAIASLSEDELVESAGALLSLALVDALGGTLSTREGEHRVLLGRGTFDAFGAIRDALAADQPDESLRAALARAEEEASGAGAYSQVVVAFEEALKSADAPAIRGHHEFHIELVSGAEVDLSRLQGLVSDSDALRKGAARIAALLSGAKPERLEFAEARKRLLPRLIGASFVERLGERFQELYSQPLGHDVHLALQLKFEDRARFVRLDEVTAWEAEGEDPVGIALVRLESARIRTQSSEIEPGVWMVNSRDGLDAARLLLPEIADAARCEARFATVPHRDALLLSDDLDELRAVTEDAYQSAPHPISCAIFELGDRLSAYDE